MKKITAFIIITAIILSLAACSRQGPITVTEIPATNAEKTTTAAPTKTVTAMPTASPSAAQNVPPSPTAFPSPARDITVIIATSSTLGSPYGEIRGGYSNGKWLSHREAAEYCKGKMTFSEYNLAEFMGTVKSSGVTHEKEYEYAGETNDGMGIYWLNLPEGGDVSENANDDYPFSYLYSGGKLPDIEVVSDTTGINSAVQNLLDKELGEGEAEASIESAVKADIDSDGKKETIVNAYSGCLCCLIESDGTVKIIDDNYSASAYYLGCFYVQNIIDIDGDGMSELVIDYTWGSDCAMEVFKYDGEKFHQVLFYYVFYDTGS